MSFGLFLDVTATVGPPQVPPRAPPDPLGDRMTSLGIRLRDLNSASYVSNGNYLTIFTEYLPGVSSSAQSLPSPLIQSLNRHFGTATTSALQNPKRKFYYLLLKITVSIQ